jgi:hypothetical protein
MHSTDILFIQHLTEIYLPGTKVAITLTQLIIKTSGRSAVRISVMKTIFILCACIIFFSFAQVSTASIVNNEAQVNVSDSAIVSHSGNEPLSAGIIGAGLVSVPEPATLFLLGSGLISFAAGARRKLKQL